MLERFLIGAAIFLLPTATCAQAHGETVTITTVTVPGVADPPTGTCQFEIHPGRQVDEWKAIDAATGSLLLYIPPGSLQTIPRCVNAPDGDDLIVNQYTRPKGQ